MKRWLSVSRGSGRRGPTSVNCVRSESPLPSTGAMKRFPSRTQVMCVSLRAHRGFDSAPDVRVICRRVPDCASTTTTSPASTKRTLRRALSHRPPAAGGMFLTSSSASLRRPEPSRPTT